jgi:hypothetical protein
MKRLAFLMCFLSSVTANAYYTVQDTGELIPEGYYAAGAELQFMTSPDSGANFIGRFDGAFDNEINYRGYVGFGERDFQIGGNLKWVPFPDVDKQPAIGFVVGPLIAAYDSHTELAVRAYPLISKKIKTENKGDFVPYGALPVLFRTYNDDSDSGMQLVIGSKYIHPDYQGVHAYAELGFKIDDSVAYVSVGATFPMNADNKFDLEPEEPLQPEETFNSSLEN